MKKNGRLAGKVLSYIKQYNMKNPQRLSPYGRVKPQANGGRKMSLYSNCKKRVDEHIVYSHVKA